MWIAHEAGFGLCMISVMTKTWSASTSPNIGLQEDIFDYYLFHGTSHSTNAHVVTCLWHVDI